MIVSVEQTVSSATKEKSTDRERDAFEFSAHALAPS